MTSLWPDTWSGAICSFFFAGAVLKLGSISVQSEYCVLNAKAEAYEQGVDVSLLDSPLEGLRSLKENLVDPDRGEVCVCVQGELIPAERELGSKTMTCVSYSSDATGQVVTKQNVLAATTIKFEDVMRTRYKSPAAGIRVVTDEHAFSKFSLGRMSVLDCCLSSPEPREAAIAINPVDLQNDFHNKSTTIFRSVRLDPSATLPSELLNLGIGVSNILCMPRSEHTYSDWFAGRFKKAINLFVPLALRCTIVGRIALTESGDLLLSAHPIVGFHVLAGKTSLRVLGHEALDRAQYYKETVLPGLDFAWKSCFAVAISMLVVRSMLQSGNSDPPAAPPARRPPSTPGTEESGGAPSTEAASASAPAAVSTDNNLCVICLSEKPTACVVPCGHHCLCDGCSISLINLGYLRCPVCCTNAEKIIRIYQP